MERYLLRSGSRSYSQVLQGDAELSPDRMAAAEACSSPSPRCRSLSPASPGRRSGSPGRTRLNIDYKHLAVEVARKLAPEIKDTLISTITASLLQIQQEVNQHATRLGEVEYRVSHVEDGQSGVASKIQSLLKENQYLGNRIEDLENRSRRNNLRLVGLAESVQPQHLQELCQRKLPEALGLRKFMRVERAHRVGPPRTSGSVDDARKQSPRQVIVRYLDFNDKEELLRSFRARNTPLMIEGCKILLFADYSMEVARKRKAFSGICSALYKKRIKFQLQYPAILKVSLPDGKHRVFRSPGEAEGFLRDLEAGIEDSGGHHTRREPTSPPRPGSSSGLSKERISPQRSSSSELATSPRETAGSSKASSSPRDKRSRRGEKRDIPAPD